MVISFGNPENVNIFGREGQDPPLQRLCDKLEFIQLSISRNRRGGDPPPVKYLRRKYLDFQRKSYVIAFRQWHFVCKMPGRRIAAPTRSIDSRSVKFRFIELLGKRTTPWLPLMRELSIADFRQLTEGEKTKKYQHFFSPSDENQRFSPPPSSEGGKGAVEI